jgi:hypothetical protein
MSDMTIHKLNPDRASAEARPFDVRISLEHGVNDIAEAILRTRTLQAFESAGARYPIHRLLRCAVPRKLVDVLDDLALASGLASQRLTYNTLLLEAPGVFVCVEGWRKSGYCSCTFNIWATGKAQAEEVRATILRTVGERYLPQDMFVIDWQFSNARGVLLSTSFEEIAQDVLHDEAYPALGEPVAAFIDRFLASSETVLILQGAPGTGKTRLVRAILGAMSRRKGESAQVMYTADKRALENDEIFVDFITGIHDAFVIEDADHLLRARTDGNQDLHRFLAVADGVVRAQGRKILFTTNLPNIRDMDEALLRPGRCFAIAQTRGLRADEVSRLAARLCGENGEKREKVLARLGAAQSGSTSVAEVYRICTQHS